MHYISPNAQNHSHFVRSVVRCQFFFLVTSLRARVGMLWIAILYFDTNVIRTAVLAVWLDH